MELARVQLARSIWLFDTADLNPRGVSLFPDVIVKLIERYGFRKFPKAEEYLQPSSRKFEEGRFKVDGQAIDVNAELWSDGITADTRHSTMASDLFVEDVINWLSEELRVSYPSAMTRKKAYRSELIMYSTDTMSVVCKKIARFADLLTPLAKEEVQITGVDFGTADVGKRSFFSFARRINEPFEANKFFSAALLQTDQHLEMLNAMERIFTEVA